MKIVEIVFYFLTILGYICEFHESDSKNCVMRLNLQFYQLHRTLGVRVGVL